ncbi:hypothetical protein HDU77_011513, partial [Chytriomyces hyalinus]
MIRVLLFLAASSIFAVNACPPNGREEPSLRNRCVCNPGFYWNDAACVPGPNNRGANGCPWHGHSNGNRCVCDQGYFWDGVECAQGPNNYGHDGCPWHGHKGGSGACECDAGYFWDSTSCAEGSGSGSPPSDGAEVSFNNNGGCLDLYGGGASGTRVNRWECLGNSNQRWTMRNDGTIRSSAQGLCLESAGVDTTVNGNPVRVWACTGGLNQQWDYNGSQLRNRRAQKCIDNTNGISTNGNPLQLWDCTNGNANQVWTHQVSPAPPPPPPPPFGGRVFRNPAGCLDLYGNGGSGTKVVLWTCMGNSNQNWILYADGTIRSQEKGLCLESAGLDNTGNGNLVQVWTCHGKANQLWDVVGGAVKNRLSQKCLDNAFNQSKDGNTIQIWDCTGSRNQQWNEGNPVPAPQDPPKEPENCEESLQTLKMTEPDWSGESVTFIDPNWEVRLAGLLAGERNLFKMETYDIPSDMVALVDRKYKYTIDFTGGIQPRHCTWEAIGLVTVLLLDNLKKSAKVVDAVNGPAQATCSFGFNQVAPLGNSTATSVFPPVVYRQLEKAQNPNALLQANIGLHVDGLATAANVTFLHLQFPVGRSPLKDSSESGCDNFVSNAIEFMFDVGDSLLPVLPFKKDKQREKIANILTLMRNGADG